MEIQNLISKVRMGPWVRNRKWAAFTLLELQITLAVLAIGLLGFSTIMRVHARQMRRAEAWCRSDPTYYMVSQSNRWMRQLGASADLNDTAGQAAWTPPVSGEQEYDIRLDSFSRDFETQVMSAGVTLQESEGG